MPANEPAHGGSGLFNISEAAARKVKDLIAGEGDERLNLRIFVVGGGCSGFEYGFELDDSINEDDVQIEKCDARMLIDSMSFQFLAGATIDYEDNLEGARFVITNPNAVSSCGCGRSFSV